MDDVAIYLLIGILMFSIGFLVGYLLLQMFYTKRFHMVAEECEKKDSIVPLISALEQET